MKECPKSDLVNPLTAEMCDCGYSFQSKTSQLVCPNCRATRGLRPVSEPALTTLLLMIGWLAGVFFVSRQEELHCQECGHAFQRPQQSYRWSAKKAALAVVFLAAVVALLLVWLGAFEG